MSLQFHCDIIIKLSVKWLKPPLMDENEFEPLILYMLFSIHWIGEAYPKNVLLFDGFSPGSSGVEESSMVGTGKCKTYNQKRLILIIKEEELLIFEVWQQIGDTVTECEQYCDNPTDIIRNFI